MKLFLFAMFLTNLVMANDIITLTSSNHVLLRNEVNDSSIFKLATELSIQVAKRGQNTYPIYLVLDSPGGSIDSGLGFIEYAKTIPNLETVTIFSASMAAGIVEALPGKRNILETGVLMFHRARGGVEGQFESGEMESRLEFYKRIVRSMEVANASRMSLSLTAYKNAVKDELWILGNEAVTKKAADRIVDVVCSPELLKGVSKEQFSIMGLFQVTVSFSKCPLLRGGSVENKKDSDLYVKYRKEKFSVGF